MGILSRSSSAHCHYIQIGKEARRQGVEAIEASDASAWKCSDYRRSFVVA